MRRQTRRPSCGTAASAGTRACRRRAGPAFAARRNRMLLRKEVCGSAPHSGNVQPPDERTTRDLFASKRPDDARSCFAPIPLSRSIATFPTSLPSLCSPRFHRSDSINAVVPPRTSISAPHDTSRSPKHLTIRPFIDSDPLLKSLRLPLKPSTELGPGRPSLPLHFVFNYQGENRPRSQSGWGSEVGSHRSLAIAPAVTRTMGRPAKRFNNLDDFACCAACISACLRGCHT